MLSCNNQVVEIFVLSGFFKWEYASNDYEQDYASRENVCLLSVVKVALLDFGSHVRHRSTVGLQGLDFSVGRESVIS